MREDPALDDATRVELFRTMMLLRSFYDAIRREVDAAAHVGPNGGMARPQPVAAEPQRPGGMRSSLLGCEPMAAGFGVYLTADDAITAPRRPHYLAIARGIDLHCVVKDAVAVAHSHPRDDTEGCPPPTAEQQLPPSSAGAGYLPAIGQAFAFQQQETGRVAVSILGRGAIGDEGFRSAVGVASSWKLPMIFLLCEEGTTRGQAAVEPVDDATDGIQTVHVRSDAVEAACMAAGQAVQRARSGDGPSIIEVSTVWPANGVTSAQPGSGEAGQDPLQAYEIVLRRRGLLDDEALIRIRNESAHRVAEAVGFVAERHQQADGACALCAQKVAS
jgi:acetoin:2,6-dichlorophenolindophenol oxidoreductase subunit alpha